MSRRRIERSVWSNGLRRRSARISALDHQEDTTTTTISSSAFPLKKKGASLTDGQHFDEGSSGVKRKRQQEGIENRNWKKHSSTNDQTVATETKENDILDNGRSLLPDKHLLELVLDVLQRRDTHEIFAEPVDPQEVEGYYEIVQKPMDFGTMRAKLHEGMYDTLEEFEHDAFLIPRNALLFNSTGSVYFRQARAIDDLAKKVFHVLKTNPKKLESEFSGTRRRSSRRLQEGKGLKIYPRSELVANVSSNDAENIFTSNGAQYSGNGSSDLNKSMKDKSLWSCKELCIGARGSEFFTVAKDGMSLDAIEVDRRSTYNPSRPFGWGNGSMLSTMSGGLQLLAHVNQGDISYSESLMKFAEGLGPVVQMVAKRKLEGCTNLQQKPKTLQVPIDLNNFHDKTNFHTIYENCMKNTIANNYSGYEVFKCDINEPWENIYSLRNGVERLNLSSIQLNDASSKSFEKVENPGLKIGFKSNFRKGLTNLRPTDGSMMKDMGVETSSLAPSTSPFAFNLSFLKSKLHQMEHHSGNQVFVGDGLSTEERSMKRTSFGYR